MRGITVFCGGVRHLSFVLWSAASGGRIRPWLSGQAGYNPIPIRGALHYTRQQDFIMKLHESKTAGANLFTAHGAGYVEINRVRHQGSLVVSADSITPWPPASFEALEEAHFAQLLALQPELVIFGSGSTLRFPHPRLSAALTNAGIGVEVMDTSAACRTYNILLAEDRRVVAALLGS
jgi:uncharacterized protein